MNYNSKLCEKQPLSKRQKTGFQDQLLLNVGQKYCRMLLKIFVLSIFEWPLKAGFYCIFNCVDGTVLSNAKA